MRHQLHYVFMNCIRKLEGRNHPSVTLPGLNQVTFGQEIPWQFSRHGGLRGSCGDERLRVNRGGMIVQESRFNGISNGKQTRERQGYSGVLCTGTSGCVLVLYTTTTTNIHRIISHKTFISLTL